MELKNYQKHVLNDLNRYCELVVSTGNVSRAYKSFWEEKNIAVGFHGLRPYQNTIENTPHVCFKVPTGGGKTFLACNSLKVIFNNMPAKRIRLVVWLVPSEAILSQTLQTLSDTSHPYRQAVDTDFNGQVQIYSKQQVLDGQQFSPAAISEQLSIVVMSFDSFRSEQKEGRKVYQENGSLQPFSKLISTPETLIKDVDNTALIQVFNQLSPVVIVDESHHTTSRLSIEMLRDLNPSFILDLTATPRENSNIISYVDAAQLKAENMVKLPVVVYHRHSKEEVIVDAIDLRNRLDEYAQKQQDGAYIRPLVLFQAQPKQNDNKTTFEQLKRQLIETGIPEEEIAIKTAEINELKGIDLLSKTCKIKYIVTVNALKEGWDCPFAYILATLANKSSTVDVEQILGRVLRLPYTHKNSCKFLNLSYVITCSSDFNATISKIVQGLNNAGFSEREYRLANPSAPIEHSSNNDQLEIKETDSELSDTTFDQKKLIDMLHERNENDKSDSLSEMLQSADMSSDTYDKALSEETDGTERYTSTGRNDMPTYRITQRFESEVLSLKIPQFFVARTRNPNLFTIADPTHRDLLTKEELENGFTLKDKDTCIDFDSVSEDVATIDIQENNQPKYLKPNENDSRDYLQMLRRLPPERRIQNCTAIIKNALGKIDNISEGDLLLYIRRVIENMDEAHLIALDNNVYGYANKIKAKIEVLLETYRKKEF